MTLIKTSILTAISTVIKVITAFVINKLVSVYIGPSGLALVGQFHNFIGMATTFATGGINAGVVKYIAEDNNEKNKSRIFSSALVITLSSSLLTGAVVIIGASYFSQLILNTIEYKNVFLIFGVTVVFFALNSFLLSVLNGQGEIKKLVYTNIAGSVFLLVLTSLLIVQLGLLGGLYAMGLNQSVVFIVTLGFVTKSSWFKLEKFILGLDKESTRKLSHYTLMALVSAISLPLMQLVVRNYIGENLGWDSAGYWQGISYISTMYLLIVTTSLGVYYLPKLSSLTDNKEIKDEIIGGYKIILPIVVIMAFGVYEFRELVIQIAFSNKFLPMEELFLWQVIGDVVKIASWLLSYLVIAKSMTKVFIYTEIGFKVTFMCFAYVFINQYGLVGVTYAFALNYLLYLITMIIIFRKVFR